jgi:hypothetical protein
MSSKVLSRPTGEHVNIGHVHSLGLYVATTDVRANKSVGLPLAVCFRYPFTIACYLKKLFHFLVLVLTVGLISIGIQKGAFSPRPGNCFKFFGRHAFFAKSASPLLPQHWIRGKNGLSAWIRFPMPFFGTRRQPPI